MLKFTQNRINALTDYILNNNTTRILSAREDWYNLFIDLLLDEQYIVKNILSTTGIPTSGFLGFLYQYFLRLDNFNILNNIKAIPSNAFEGSDIEEIIIPGNIKEIPLNAFAYSKVRHITLEEGVESIQALAFSTCINLISIDLPRSLRYIGRRAFESCSSLTNINYAGTINQWTMISKDRPIFSAFSPTNPIERKLKCTDGEFQIN